MSWKLRWRSCELVAAGGDLVDEVFEDGNQGVVGNLERSRRKTNKTEEIRVGWRLRP